MHTAQKYWLIFWMNKEKEPFYIPLYMAIDEICWSKSYTSTCSCHSCQWIFTSLLIKIHWAASLAAHGSAYRGKMRASWRYHYSLLKSTCIDPFRSFAVHLWTIQCNHVKSKSSDLMWFKHPMFNAYPHFPCSMCWTMIPHNSLPKSI